MQQRHVGLLIYIIHNITSPPPLPMYLSFPSLLWLPFHFPKVATFPARHLVNANYEGVKEKGKTVNLFLWYVWSTHNQHCWKFRQHLQTFGNAVNPKQSSSSGGHLSCRRVLFSQDTRFTIRWRRQISESDHRLVQAGLRTTDLGVCEIHLIQYITDLFKQAFFWNRGNRTLVQSNL